MPGFTPQQQPDAIYTRRVAIRTEQFEFNGRKLRVVAIEAGGVWTVTIRENDHTVGLSEYQISAETVNDAAIDINPLDLVAETMKIARRDVEDDIVGLKPANP